MSEISAPSWEDLRRAMVRAVDLIDAGAAPGEVKYALIQPFEHVAHDELARRKSEQRDDQEKMDTSCGR